MKRRHRPVLAAIVFTHLLSPGSVLAQDDASTPEPPTGTASRESSLPARLSKDPVVWWRPFGLYDYLATAATVGLFYAAEFGLGNPEEASWDQPIPIIDEPMRDLLVAGTRSKRERADSFSDYGWYTSIGYPLLVSAIAPPVRGGSFEMIWELEMMNIRSFVVASLVTRLPHKLIGRKRPNSVGCAEDPDYDAQCDSPAQNQSFFGGHTTMSMTGAGLACTHHLHAELYGAQWADAAGCGGALAVAAGTMIMRQRADRHWMSDNLVGAAVGLAVGYGLPTVLNYHPFWQGEEAGAEEADRQPHSAHEVRWDIVPIASETMAGGAIVGLF